MCVLKWKKSFLIESTLKTFFFILKHTSDSTMIKIMFFLVSPGFPTGIFLMFLKNKNEPKIFSWIKQLRVSLHGRQAEAPEGAAQL